jgi:CBS domain-containing protein
MGKKVRDLMSSDPRCVQPSTPLPEAARRRMEEDVGSLPVCEGQHLVGIVTDRDIVVRGVASGGGDLGSRTVGEVATHDVGTVAPDADLDEALRLMAERKVRRLPVVEGDGRLVGILAQADVAEGAPEKKTGEVVEAISKD